MLQPKSYPELVGKALVLEAEPFLVMAEDDNPWVEGLFLVTCMGVLLAGAHLVGGLLWTATLPPADAMRQPCSRSKNSPPKAGYSMTRPRSKQLFVNFGVLSGHNPDRLSGGFARFFSALLQPIGLVLQWLFLALTTHIARGYWVAKVRWCRRWGLRHWRLRPMSWGY